jgi:hypothetical protein
MSCGEHRSNDLLGDVSAQDSSSMLELTLYMIKHLYDIPEKNPKPQITKNMMVIDKMYVCLIDRSVWLINWPIFLLFGSYKGQV